MLTFQSPLATPPKKPLESLRAELDADRLSGGKFTAHPFITR